MIKFSGEFVVPGEPANVMKHFADVPRMAGCMPGASVAERDADGNYPGTILVAFGPKKIKFNGILTCEFNQADFSGIITGRGAASVRGAQVGVRATFNITPDSGPSKEGGSQSRVSIQSEAEFSGVLADFAKTGGVAVANVLMKEFAKNAAREFSQGSIAPHDETLVERDSRPEAFATPARPQEVRALSAGKVFWETVKHLVRSAFSRKK